MIESMESDIREANLRLFANNATDSNSNRSCCEEEEEKIPRRGVCSSLARNNNTNEMTKCNLSGKRGSEATNHIVTASTDISASSYQEDASMTTATAKNRSTTTTATTTSSSSLLDDAGSRARRAEHVEPTTTTLRASVNHHQQKSHHLLHDDQEEDVVVEGDSASTAFLLSSVVRGTTATTTTTTRASTTRSTKTAPDHPLTDIMTINHFLSVAGIMVLSVYVILLLLVYGLTPRDRWIYLSRQERDSACLAFGVMFIATLLLLSPVGVSSANTNKCNTGGTASGSTPITGIVQAAVLIQLIAMITNGILAFCPSVVIVDPVTQARVFLVRWCEWTPLAGLMTFLSDAVDVPKSKRGLRVPILMGLSQSLSVICGLLLPLCPNLLSWLVVMIISCVTYFFMFPRLWYKYKKFQATPKGTTFLETERYDRIKFAYHLMLVCTSVWTLLVIMYFLNMMVYTLLPVGHGLRHESLAMMVDTFFDVVAKALYMKLIVEVHHAVFDAEGRAQRQLTELRRLMSALWDSSSDVIVISVRDHQNHNTGGDNNNNYERVTSMFSPSFPGLVGADLPPEVAQRKAAALMVETEFRLGSNPQAGTDDDHHGIRITAAFYVDSSEIPYGGTLRRAILAPVDIHGPKANRAMSIIAAAWNKFRPPPSSVRCRRRTTMSTLTRTTTPTPTTTTADNNASLLLVHPIERIDGEDCKCEIKVSRHAENAIVAVVRDVTERYRRFEAERRAHAESVARQKDAQTVNRFTRHEVKNGLLSGIELCDSLRKALDEVHYKMMAAVADADAAAAAQQGDHPFHPAHETKTRVMMNGNNNSMRRAQSEANGFNLSSSFNLPRTLSFVDENVPVIMTSNRSSSSVSIAASEIVPRRYIDELDKTLHEILDTVLAEAMARDVIHEVYHPRVERLDVMSVLAGSGIGVGQQERFPLVFDTPYMPHFQLDPQLLRYIHRNAVSNACKYGKVGGQVLTKVSFNDSSGILKLEVINEPGNGHEEIMVMGEAASEAVFKQGSRLHAYFELEQDKQISSGDGAWIMQKCAKTMGGVCHIRFERERTVFSFECEATPVDAVKGPSTQDFEVPPGTWGIAVDDSKIQRKLMERILNHAGIDESRRIVLGQNAAEVEDLEMKMLRLVREYPYSKFLVLVDENLDFGESKTAQVILSGSIVMRSILEKMSQDHVSRVLCLVRSANDSAEDVALYTKRTHGFFPKAPMRRERVREILAPLWTDRFEPPLPSPCEKKDDDDDAPPSPVAQDDSHEDGKTIRTKSECGVLPKG